MTSLGHVERRSVEDAVRTTVAAILSLLVAELFRMPEAYWATITTIIIMQSTLGAALSVSGQRLAGTVLGAGTGALLATYFDSNLAMFGVGLFLLGILCAVLRLETAYRFAGVTLAIIVLIGRDRSAWVIAEHRLIEVSVGIAVGLMMTIVWPERDSGGPYP